MPPSAARTRSTRLRWPDFAEAALRRGVRCSVHLVRELPRGALVLSLFGVRPGVLDAESNPMADMLAAFGGAMLTNATAYNQAQRTASQLKDAVVARSVTDQAKGILMHALGCDADEALKRLRQESQRRHVKVTEVATEVVAAYSGEEPASISLAKDPPGRQSPRRTGDRGTSGRYSWRLATSDARQADGGCGCGTGRSRAW